MGPFEMPKINTSELTPERLAALSFGDSYQIYNGLDCCVTSEVFSALDEELKTTNDPGPQLVYDFERGMQAPALDMMLRGFKTDAFALREAVKELLKRKARLQNILDRYTKAIWGVTLNTGSPVQMREFFYYSPKGLCLPEQHKIERGIRKVSTNRECLEKLSAYFYALPIINVILAIRDTSKKISVLTSEVDADGRMRTSYNVAGTETGRWSSSANAFGGGTNLQNITPELRVVFIADEGYKLCYLDLEQAESYCLGLLAWMVTGDDSYFRACNSGDLHTTVAKLVWSDLPWNGDKKHDREIADRAFYRQFSYRDMAKRGGHGTNYYGTPPTMARHLKVETKLIHDFQRAYFGAFPCIPGYHRWTAHQLGVHQSLSTPLGDRRTFFGRPNDDSTLREAIAHGPQSMVGRLLNVVLYRIWKRWGQGSEVQLLGQVHDAVVFQYKEELELEVLPEALALARIPLTVNGQFTPIPGSKFPSNLNDTRTMTIPSECKIGWNWSDDVIRSSTGKKIANPNGLIKWKGERDQRKRIGGLDRVVS